MQSINRAAIAVAVSSPTPGMVRSRRTTSLCLAMDSSCRSTWAMRASSSAISRAASASTGPNDSGTTEAASEISAQTIWRGRLEALDLFRCLAEETGARLGYSYPTQLEETVMTWVRSQAPEPEIGRPTLA